MSLLVKKLHSNAILPTRAYPDDAGYDLYSLEKGVIPARGRGIVSTGISIKIRLINTVNYYASIRSRSGLSAKHGIEVGAGVIDASYRGEIKVVLFNHSDNDFEYDQGAKIAQMIIQRHEAPALLSEVAEFQDDENIRGRAGFGSTGYY
jgi:dUTP pyrophosphatase